jgi:hypothetical protein
MAFESLWIHTAFSEGCLQVFSAMQTLTAGGDFDAMEQEIEALRGPFCSPRCCIEWPTSEGKSDDKHGGNSRLLLGKRAQLPFPFRIEVIRQVRSSEVFFQKLKASVEFPCRHVEHRWKGWDSMSPKNISVRAHELVKHIRKQFTLDLDDILRAVNKAYLKIE